jgi:DNA adenine methylase
MLPYFDEYREPMMGGRSMFLGVLSKFPNKKYWVNDINYDLYCFWKTLKENGNSLAHEAEKLKEEFSLKGKELFYYLKNSTPNSEFEIGVRFYVLDLISFSGLVDAGGYSDLSFQERFTYNAISRLKLIAPFLRKVRITNFNYSDILLESGKNLFFYLDPPYYSQRNSKLYGRKGRYHTIFDHSAFAEAVKMLHHKWLLSYDDSEYIRELYSSYKSKTISLIASYGMNNVWKTVAPKGKELMITNFNLENELLI